MHDAGRSLEGIRVLDLSRLLPAPFATMVLADLGAQVDKLEDPKGGDFCRVTPPYADDGMGTMFHWINRGKRSIVLDLKQEEGRKAFEEIIPRYDVLIESNRPGVMDRLGVGYEALSELHPGLVYCALTGYGQDGPLWDRAGHDINYLARAGVLGLTGPVDAPPQPPGVQMADVGGGLYAVVGILAALQERSRTGKGRMVDISMTEGAVSFATFGLSCFAGGFDMPRGTGTLMGAIAPYCTYSTKDGGAIALGALEPKFWKAFCEGTGLESDASAQSPGPHQKEWKEKVAAIIAERTTEEWVAFGEKWDCCLEPVLTPEQTMSDAQHAARGVFVERKTREGTPIRIARTPVAPPAEGAPPRQGEQSGEILKEAGFSEDRIAALREAGITR